MGTVTARNASTISSKLLGVVFTVHVLEGDLVKKGDLLITIDQRQVNSQLEQALANAQLAENQAR